MRSLAVTLALVLIVGGGSLTAVVMPFSPEPAPTDESIAKESTTAVAPSACQSLQPRSARLGSRAAPRLSPLKTAGRPSWNVAAAFRAAMRGPLIC